MSPLPPHTRTVRRTVTVGGMTKAELLAELQRHGVQMNEAGRNLFASDLFQTSATRRTIETVEFSVLDLGFPQGSTMPQLHEAAAARGLTLCPMELGPHLRLQYLDQPEDFLGPPHCTHRAPSGSITIAAPHLSEDDDFPKGFYLRRNEGILWLRGYWSGLNHIYSPEDRLVFATAPAAGLTRKNRRL
ncbi:MAG TPA: hypothetical protein VG796_21540 [Verrucomicrobiales bacterium]|nr:hypothetical protein [Verrucomicrobiales bacterium]